jgi:putative ABC transport system permease protein
MTNILADLRYAMRTLGRSPLFAAVAILSLALGIGANTAIFTLMDQILLRKLPIRDPDSLVMLYQEGANNGSNMGTRMQSYPIYQDYQKKVEPFSEVLCRRLINTSLSVDNRTERVDAEMVSGNFFSMLGVKAAAGRVFNSKEDDRIYQGHTVVVLSYNYWATRFRPGRRAAFLAQEPDLRAGCVELPLAVRRRTFRTEPAKFENIGDRI